MRVRASLGSLSFALLFAPPAARPDGPPSQTLAIVTEFEHPPNRDVRDALRRETVSLFRLQRLRIVWEDLAQAVQGSVHERMVVVRFRGHCQAGMPATPVSLDAPLAFTHVTNGVVLPFAEVDCDRVRRSVARAVAARGPELDAALGRALARVAAHEIFHMLTGSLRHGSRGLAKSHLTAGELTGAGFGFDPLDLERLRETLFGRQLALAAGAGAPAP